METSPDVGLSSPVSMVTRVDLPAPEAPTNATMLLGGMVRLTLSRTLSDPSYSKETLVRLMGRLKSGVAPESLTDSSRSASSRLSIWKFRTLPDTLRKSWKDLWAFRA